jgi:activating signal cointegrator complex subunit 3
VPLTQTFIGVTKTNVKERNDMMIQIAYERALIAIRRGKQVMVFVHARSDTVRTARALLELAREGSQTATRSPRRKSSSAS